MRLSYLNLYLHKDIPWNDYNDLFYRYATAKRVDLVDYHYLVAKISRKLGIC